ncbi:MAG: hypothetical protein ACRDIX_06620 [Actinomycetota bacterium]
MSAAIISLVVAGSALVGMVPASAQNKPTAEFSDGTTVIYEGPTEVRPGEPFTVRICVRDRNGNPVSGKRMAVTLGDPPTSGDATHGAAITDQNGCADIEMENNQSVGRTVLWTSDFKEVARLATMEIVSPEQPSPSPAGPRVSTEPTGGGALRQFFIFIIVIGGIVIVGGFYVFWTTRERGRAGKPEEPGVTTGPGETPEPGPGVTLTPDWIPEKPVCDWAAYYAPVGGKPVVIRAANGTECCVYKVSLVSHVYELEEVTRERQDGPAGEGEVGRRNFQSASIHPLGVNTYVEASSRSGPEDSLGWMQGLGDLHDRGSRTPQSPEPWPGGATPDSSGSARLDEVTTLSVSLESDCPGHQNTFDVGGSSDLSIGANQECTNETDGECPVELTASAWAVGNVDGAISYSVGHLAGGDPNEQEAALAGLGDGERTFHAITDLHDHEELDRSDYVGGDDASGSAQTEGDAVSIAVRNFVVVDAGSLVPREVWPSTNRVTATVETSLSHSFDVHADMTRVDCVDAPCCALPAGGAASFFDVGAGIGGHASGPPVTECMCDPSLTVHLVGATAQIMAGGNTLTVTRPGAVLVGQDQPWEPS